MPHRFLFVMDPLSQVLVDKDTTFAFMLEAVARGHEVYFAGLERPRCARPSAVRLRAAM